MLDLSDNDRILCTVKICQTCQVMSNDAGFFGFFGFCRIRLFETTELEVLYIWFINCYLQISVESEQKIHIFRKCLSYSKI